MTYPISGSKTCKKCDGLIKGRTDTDYCEDCSVAHLPNMSVSGLQGTDGEATWRRNQRSAEKQIIHKPISDE